MSTLAPGRVAGHAGAETPQPLPLRSDLAIIAGWVAPGSRVLALKGQEMHGAT